MRETIRGLLLGAALLLLLLLFSFALPVRTWRTGQQPRPPLELSRGESAAAPSRIWIDTDAACGPGPRTDPDDCLALLLLAHTPGIEITGISSVFGNASLDVTDRTTRELVDILMADGLDLPGIHRGAASARSVNPPEPVTDATVALQAALAEGPLAIVALGPLTNIAAALEGRSDLWSRVTFLAAVMGRRTGHLFHPSEGGGSGILFGHGPIFRDFNFALDIRAAETVLETRLPLVLIPYVAGRDVEIAGDDLDRLSAQGGARAWVAARCRGWLTYWREEIGRNGFYPFDAVAAAYARDPGQLRCAEVSAWVGDDPTMFIPFWNPLAFLVTQNREQIVAPSAQGPARYCPTPVDGFERALQHWLSGEPHASQ